MEQENITLNQKSTYIFSNIKNKIYIAWLVSNLTKQEVIVPFFKTICDMVNYMSCAYILKSFHCFSYI